MEQIQMEARMHVALFRDGVTTEGGAVQVCQKKQV